MSNRALKFPSPGLDPARPGLPRRNGSSCQAWGLALTNNHCSGPPGVKIVHLIVMNSRDGGVASVEVIRVLAWASRNQGAQDKERHSTGKSRGVGPINHLLLKGVAKTPRRRKCSCDVPAADRP